MTSVGPLPIGLLILDEHATVVDASAEAARILEYAVEELRGRRLAELLPLAARAFFQTHLFPTLALKGRVEEAYVPLRSKPGEPRPVLLSGLREAHDDRYTDCIVFMPMNRRQLSERELVMARDEARRSAEGEDAALQQVSAMQAQLAMASSLASVGLIAAGVAHEVNNPLTYVSGNVELVQAALRSQEKLEQGEIEEILADVKGGLERIRDIVATLKKLSRAEKSGVEAVDAARALDSALKMSAPELKRRARVDVQLPSPLPLVMANEGRLCQVLINLLVNAAQALGCGDVAKNLIVVSADVQEDAVELVVTDNGPGVPEAIRERIFDPFFTTKAAGEGTGLGLALCRSMVGELGGTLELESPVEGGARFRLRLPRATGSVAQVAAASSAPAPRAVPASRDAVAPRRALVVDDEAPITRLVARMLGGYRVDECHDGKQALARIEEQGDDAYDVLVLDITMPEMGGIELAERLAARAPRWPERIVFVTGGATPAEQASPLRKLGAPILRKPFSVRDLVAACDRAARA